MDTYWDANSEFQFVIQHTMWYYKITLLSWVTLLPNATHVSDKPIWILRSFPFLLLNTLDWFHWSVYTKTFLINFFFFFLTISRNVPHLAWMSVRYSSHGSPCPFPHRFSRCTNPSVMYGKLWQVTVSFTVNWSWYRLHHYIPLCLIVRAVGY